MNKYHLLVVDQNPEIVSYFLLPDVKLSPEDKAELRAVSGVYINGCKDNAIGARALKVFNRTQEDNDEGNCGDWAQYLNEYVKTEGGIFLEGNLFEGDHYIVGVYHLGFYM